MCRIGFKKHYSDGYVSKLKQIQDGISVSGFYKTYGEIGLLPENKSKLFNNLS
jgi:hypothetical protein